MDIWVAGISNQVFIKDSYAELKTKLVTGSFAWNVAISTLIFSTKNDTLKRHFRFSKNISQS